jgi:diadenosine tetraphosphate (Ap4A) HIT family hydrolase
MQPAAPVPPSDCLVCRKHRGQIDLPGGLIFENELVYISHALLYGDETEHYLGHLFVETRRHVAELADLTEAEAQALGLWVSRSARALMAIQGVVHVYSFVIGDGMPHIHVHVIGRYADAPKPYWGSRVDEWPGAPHGAGPEMAEVTARLRDFFVRTWPDAV